VTIPDILSRIVEGSARRAWLVVLAGIVLAAACIGLAATRLSVTTDLNRLFADSLPWKQRSVEFEKQFPQFSNLIVAVIDAKIPEEADAVAAAVSQAMTADTAHFISVRRPDSSPYFDKNGLMFLDTAELGPLLDQTVDAQPFLGQLVADPSARGLFAALSLIGVGVERGQANLAPFAPALAAFHASLASAIAGAPQPLSWQRLLSGSLAEKAGPFRFVLMQPKLDYKALQPGGLATAAIRDFAATLGPIKSGDAHLRITGDVPLADEEFATAARGAVAGLAASFFLVAVWLFLAVRSWRLIVPILFTLILGLLLTTGFATLAVGTLNLISVAFAILFVGIAVDFAIQFSVRFRDMHLHRPVLLEALGQTARRVGIQIFVAALATASGFLAFVPTSFSGVAELGLIAGAGMLIAFACTIVFLPAALALLKPPAEAEEVGFTILAPLDAWLVRWRQVLLAGFGLLAVLGIFCVPRLVFDADPLHTKDPNTEAMLTLRDLMANPLSNPYSIDILQANLAAADATAKRISGLPLVAGTLTIDSLVPTDQPAKLALIADAANILGPTLSARTPAAPVTPDAIRLAARTASGQLAKALPKLPAGDPLVALAHDLDALGQAPDATVMAANGVLTRYLPEQIGRLRTALTAAPVTLSDVPPSITRDWLLPDGRARVQVTAKPGAENSTGLHAFVAEVMTVAPDAGGSAVTIIATSDTIITAFKRAAIGAVVLIAVILFAVLRRILDVALVLAALLLSAMLTVLICILLPLQLNFANIIALPLLLGVGVSFNIYFVMNWRAGEHSRLSSATARAVIFSALTTATAFGSLALSAHPGTASMGKLLLISLACTLLVTMLFIPALLASLRDPAARMS
jgi:hopanoid biosynthesis associated RND transporter like protein HpnN